MPLSWGKDLARTGELSFPCRWDAIGTGAVWAPCNPSGPLAVCWKDGSFNIGVKLGRC